MKGGREVAGGSRKVPGTPQLTEGGGGNPKGRAGSVNCREKTGVTVQERVEKTQGFGGQKKDRSRKNPRFFAHTKKGRVAEKIKQKRVLW